MNLLLIIY